MSSRTRENIKVEEGATIGNWTVMSSESIKGNGVRRCYWRCRCKCGTEKTVRDDQLKSGESKSCGCLKKEKLSERTKTHGKSGHHLHKKWISVKQRCNNPNAARYSDYGGKGIKVCREWTKDFMSFYKWSLQNGYSPNLTLDRIDNDGDYCPENCRYISNAEQQLNRSNNHVVKIGNEELTIKEWCDKGNINRNTFVWRLRNGWTGRNLLNKVKM